MTFESHVQPVISRAIELLIGCGLSEVIDASLLSDNAVQKLANGSDELRDALLMLRLKANEYNDGWSMLAAMSSPIQSGSDLHNQKAPVSMCPQVSGC